MRILLWCLVALLLAALMLAALGFSRLRSLSGRPSSFESALRQQAGEALGPWQAGIAEYRSDRLLWWRSWSLMYRPHGVWLREQLVLSGRVEIAGSEVPDLWMVRCRYEDTPFELIMSGGAYAGFASWLESAPPNQRYSVV